MTQKRAALGPCAYTEWYFNPCGRKAFALGDRFGKQVPLCRKHYHGREWEATKRLHTRASLVPVLVAALRRLVDAHDQIPSMLTADDWTEARAAIAKATSPQAR